VGYKYRIKGQITVFLSLILLLLLSLVFTCLESARSEGLQLRAELAAGAALQSVFAQYDRNLWNHYGLLFFAGRNLNEIQTIAEEYGKENCGGGTLLAGDWLALDLQSVQIDSAVTATEQEGTVFRRAVCDYMEAAGLVETVKKLFNGLSSDDSEELSISDMLEKASGLEQSIEDTEALLPEGETQERDKEAEGVVKSLLKCLRKWKQKGFLNVVAENADQVSSKNYKTDGFPSKIASSAKTVKHCTLPEESGVEKLLFYEYLIRHLDEYITSEGKNCQVEYVITGKSSDRDSLNAVVKRLLAIRYGIDLVWLSTNQTKRSEARTLAIAATGWTANPAITETCLSVILMIWALGEAISDVKTLMEGKRLPLIKTECSVHLTDLAADAQKTKDSQSGLSYEDYLRILLITQGKKTTAYRAMDMIQLQIREAEPAFAFLNCYYGAQITMEMESDALFPFLPSNAGHAFSESQDYAYGTVLSYQ